MRNEINKVQSILHHDAVSSRPPVPVRDRDQRQGDEDQQPERRDRLRSERDGPDVGEAVDEADEPDVLGQVVHHPEQDADDEVVQHHPRNRVRRRPFDDQRRRHVNDAAASTITTATAGCRV